MKKELKKNWEKIVLYHMDDDIREWTHYNYAPCKEEKFLKEYFLRLIYEKGPEEAEKLEELLWEEYEINIDDLITWEEKQEAEEMYKTTDEYGTYIGEKE